MTKNEFLLQLKNELKKNNISDLDDILSEYEQHFAFKLADGYSEEEIAAKLGDPAELASQFIPNAQEKKYCGRKVVTVIGMIFADLFAGAFFLMFFIFAAVLGIVAVAAVILGICLLGRLNFNDLIPNMPYLCAFIFAVSFFAFAILSAAACLYFVVFTRQLIRSYKRFHINVIASSSGKATLPSLPVYPLLSHKFNRRLRMLVLSSVTMLAVSLVSGYIISAIIAGNLEFWHVWGWFVK